MGDRVKVTGEGIEDGISANLQVNGPVDTPTMLPALAVRQNGEAEVVNVLRADSMQLTIGGVKTINPEPLVFLQVLFGNSGLFVPLLPADAKRLGRDLIHLAEVSRTEGWDAKEKYHTIKSDGTVHLEEIKDEETADAGVS